MQVHYLKPRIAEDATAIEAVFAPDPLPESVSVIMFASGFDIPPGRASFNVSDHCCLDSFAPVQPLAFRVHAHELGRRIWLDAADEPVRQGTAWAGNAVRTTWHPLCWQPSLRASISAVLALSDNSRCAHFLLIGCGTALHSGEAPQALMSYRLQTTIASRDPQLPQLFERLPDDTPALLPGMSLQSTCDFNSTTRSSDTHAGFAHKDEMCNMCGALVLCCVLHRFCKPVACAGRQPACLHRQQQCCRRQSQIPILPI
jgi:Copper type II ascorbate-dependent monooxygenase, C-terminal domain